MTVLLRFVRNRIGCPVLIKQMCGLSKMRELRFQGKKIAISGILNFYKREEAFSLIKECEGIPQSFVTRDTDYLIIGRYRANSIHGEKSNKRKLAEKYIKQGKKIKIIREDEFLGMLWGDLINYGKYHLPTA